MWYLVPELDPPRPLSHSELASSVERLSWCVPVARIPPFPARQTPLQIELDTDRGCVWGGWVPGSGHLYLLLQIEQSKHPGFDKKHMSDIVRNYLRYHV